AHPAASRFVPVRMDVHAGAVELRPHRDRVAAVVHRELDFADYLVRIELEGDGRFPAQARHETVCPGTRVTGGSVRLRPDCERTAGSIEGDARTPRESIGVVPFDKD